MKPTILDLCAAGERAVEDEEFEDAVEWYELACGGTIPAPYSPIEQLDEHRRNLFANRFTRLTELRQMMPWRKPHFGSSPRGHMIAIQTCVSRQLTPSLKDELARWPGPKVVQVDGRDGTWMGQAKSFFAILLHAAAYSGLTYLTVFEDDIVLAQNAVEYISLHRPDPDLVLTSWFSVETCTIPRTRPVLSTISAREYMFNQAITMPASTVRTIVASEAMKKWPEPHGADRIFGHVYPKGKCALHFPSIVQHTGGADSLVGNNHHGLRTSPTFIGETADALALMG